MSKKIIRSENGISLILAAFLIAIFLSLAALVISLGLIASNKSKLQNVANLIALGALEKVIIDNSAIDALNKAKEILDQADLPTLKSNLGDLSTDDTGTSGKVTFGTWHNFAPTGSNPCIDYPCFEPNTAAADWNAAKVKIKNQAVVNPILTPLAKVFGYNGAFVEVEATAAVGGQCTVVLQDVSLSTTYDTHKSFAGAVTPALFVFPADNYDCIAPLSPDEEIWCNMQALRPIGSVDKKVHYQSDYSAIGGVYLDTFRNSNYIGPEPFTNFALGINVALRELYETSGGSFWRYLSFGDTPNDWFPTSSEADNPGAIIQAVNLDNAGITDEFGSIVKPITYPNFIDLEIFPASSSATKDNTNIIQALELAVNEFSNCPSSYKRTILLLSDGIGNCYKNSTGYDCDGEDFEYYLEYEKQLRNFVIPYLNTQGVSVVTVVDGSHAAPHFMNIAAPVGYDAYGGILDLDQAVALKTDLDSLVQKDGFTDSGFNSTWAASNCTGLSASDCKDKYIYSNLSKSLNFFPRATALMAELALDTNGVFCPLLVKGDSWKYVDHDSNPETPNVLHYSQRKVGEAQLIATKELSKARQVSECIKSDWSNKFTLVEE